MAVIDYLDWRNRQEDEAKRVTSDGGYLFIVYEIPEEYRRIKNEGLRKLEKKSIIDRYRGISLASGKKADAGNYNLISPNMRRFLKSTLLANGASIFFTDFLLGHEIDATRAAYYGADPTSLKKEYQTYIPFLTFEKQLDVSESEDFKRIKAQNETLIVEAKITEWKKEIIRHLKKN